MPLPSFDTIYRKTLLSVADAKPVASFMQRQGWRLGVGRFVAGERLEDGIRALSDLHAQGLDGILDLLGEFVDTREGSEAMVREILEALELLGTHDGSRHMSVKPTQLGLAVDGAFAREQATLVMNSARDARAHVCLDMENHPYVDGTLDLFEHLRTDGFTNVSTVLQSYLRRSEDDLERLLGLDPLPDLRIVKGAYRESERVAYPDKATVDRQYRTLVLRALERGAYVNIATHDERIIQDIEAHVRTHGITPDRYEFQLLYGVRLGLQRDLLTRGHRVRIYVPYGRDWYGYFSRRLAERPANLAFVARGLFG